MCLCQSYAIFILGSLDRMKGDTPVNSTMSVGQARKLVEQLKIEASFCRIKVSVGRGIMPIETEGAHCACLNAFGECPHLYFQSWLPLLATLRYQRRLQTWWHTVIPTPLRTPSSHLCPPRRTHSGRRSSSVHSFETIHRMVEKNTVQTKMYIYINANT